MKSDGFKITAGFILICLIWGSTWLAIKIGLDSFTPLGGAGLRFMSAAIMFYLIIKYKKIEVQKDKLAYKIYLMLAFFSYIFPYALVYWGERYISTGLTSILFGIMPFGVVILSRIMLPENRISKYQWIGIIAGFAGLVVIFSQNLKVDLKNDFWGMIGVLTAAVMQAVVAVIMKKHSGKLNPLALNYYPTLIAGPVLLIAGFLMEDSSKWVFNAQGVGSFLYLALFGTVIAFSVYYWLMKKMNVVILSLNSFVTPIIAVILGAFILAEKFTMRDLLGSSFVLIGILFANFDGIINYFRKKRLNIEV